MLGSTICRNAKSNILHADQPQSDLAPAPWRDAAPGIAAAYEHESTQAAARCLLPLARM